MPTPVDNDYTVDLDDIIATIATSDVVVMRFVALGQRLLLDFRANDVEGPLVRVVRPVKSVQERYRDLRKMRPRFSDPERIVAIWWPRFAASLRESPAWQCVLERVSEAGHPAAVRGAQAAIDELVRLERRAARDAVSGEGFRTLWSASARRR
jgi:hypothetical protein